MATPEEPRVSGTGEKKFQLILPSLMPPLPGAFDDVCLDYAISPERFKVAMQARVRTENPWLVPIFRESPYLPEGSDLPYQWTHVYYGMFERAARKLGIPPMQVLEETARKNVNIQLLITEDELFNRSEEEVIENEHAAWEKRKAKDRELSPELDRFWNAVEADIKELKEQGEDDGEILNMLTPITALQLLLQKQQEAYSLIEAYSLK